MTKKDVIKLVDELGELDRKLAAVAPLKKRAEAIKETLRGLMDACGPEEVGSFEGARYVATISQRQLERRPIAALFDRLGKKRFLEIAKVSLKSIEALFKPHEIPDLVTSERTGPRAVTVAPRLEAVLKSAA